MKADVRRQAPLPDTMRDTMPNSRPLCRMTSFKRQTRAVSAPAGPFLRGDGLPAHRRRTEAGDAAFLAALARGESVRVAAAATGCSRQALYQRRIGDHAFAQRWREAEDAALTSRRNAVPCKRPGTTRPVFEVRNKRMSDSLILARLKALVPTSYR